MTSPGKMTDVAMAFLLWVLVVTIFIIEYIVFPAVTSPPQRWDAFIGDGRIERVLSSSRNLRRSDIWRIFGVPDEPNVAKDYDMWIDHKFTRKHMTIVYNTSDSTSESDPEAVYVFYESAIKILDQKIKLVMKMRHLNR